MHHFDFFGCLIGFRVNGYTRYKTKIGGYFTVTAGLFGIAIVSLFSQEFIKRQEPRNIDENKKVYFPPEIDLMQKNFAFAITTSFNDVHSLKNDIFKIKAYLVKIKNSKMANEKKVKIPLIPCNENKFKGLEDNYRQLNLNNALCVNQNSSIFIKGSYSFSNNWNKNF